MMPSKKKKYNARFPAGRIKKIMQTDDDVGKVAQAVPVIISRSLELFVESLLTKTVEVTNAKNAKTLTPSHMKQCILSESRFDFLKDLVSNISDVSVAEEEHQSGPAGPAPVASYFPPTKKESAGRGRGRGRPSTRLNATATATSLRQKKTSLPKTPTTPTVPAPVPTCPPAFYRETQISSGLNTLEPTKDLLMCRPPVIHHTGPSQPLPNPIDSGDEEEEEETTNGYTDFAILPTRTLLIDDDYDT